MKRIGITGYSGFLGWHLRCQLQQRGISDVELADRSVLMDMSKTTGFVEKCDVIVHIAGVNRADTEEEVYAGNIEPANKIIKAIDEVGVPKTVIYANTRQSPDSGVYGKAKHEVANLFGECQERNSGQFIDIIFPHLFGEYGKPFYNSAVHTFAYQIMHSQETRILTDAQLELIHAQDAAVLIVDNMESESKIIKPIGRSITVKEIEELMRNLAEPYLERGSIPEFSDTFELDIFNAMKSQISESHFPVSLTPHCDDRGCFYEVLRAFGEGQTSLSTTNPGIIRGGHYHRQKIERFLVISGSAEIRLRRLFSNDVYSILVDGDNPAYVDIPTMTTHDIKNTGSSTLTTLFWSNDHFNPEVPDTYLEPVEVG